MMLEKEHIRGRLRTEDTWITSTDPTSPTALTDAVPEQKMRFIVGIHLNGDAQANRQVDIYKQEEDDTYTIKFSNVPVQTNDHVELPESGYDIDDPILGLEGGTRLYGIASGNSINGTVIYWDSPEL